MHSRVWCVCKGNSAQELAICMLVCEWSDHYRRCEWRNRAIQRKDEVRVWHGRPLNPALFPWFWIYAYMITAKYELFFIMKIEWKYL